MILHPTTPIPPPSLPAESMISLVIEIPALHLQRLHTLLDTDHSLSLDRAFQSALLLYLAYKRPELFCPLPPPRSAP